MDNVRVLFSPYVLPMVLIMSVIGVVTSLFLKNLDSVHKTIASALELVFLPLLMYIYLLLVEITGTEGLPVYTKVVSGEGVEEKMM
ncbi:hypothetical protein BBJ29_009844 [Phytophthora kernoviae]|uniref:Amino acid transporter n=1 Tax=Phytophthora kernoviae TaxID=325452 RepID=A0A3F2S2J0_9STRA|nr:hypothetical protein BBJ29_009844 [Phytophthora kernoviae]RLN69002.1 hypothetical protein BBP00_00000699 [Phytophthora kernoviae]